MIAFLGFLKLVPLKIWLIFGAITTLVIVHLALVHEAVAKQEEEDKVEAQKITNERNDALAKLKTAQGIVITKETVKYVDRVKVIGEQAHDIQIIPLPKSDADLVLTPTWRVLHDAAASGIVPRDIPTAIRAAAPVEVDTATETIKDNYTSCRLNAAQLLALQAVVQQLKGEVK